MFKLSLSYELIKFDNTNYIYISLCKIYLQQLISRVRAKAEISTLDFLLGYE